MRKDESGWAIISHLPRIQLQFLFLWSAKLVANSPPLSWAFLWGVFLWTQRKWKDTRTLIWFQSYQKYPASFKEESGNRTGGALLKGHYEYFCLPHYEYSQKRMMISAKILDFSPHKFFVLFWCHLSNHQQTFTTNLNTCFLPWVKPWPPFWFYQAFSILDKQHRCATNWLSANM